MFRLQPEFPPNGTLVATGPLAFAMIKSFLPGPVILRPIQATRRASPTAFCRYSPPSSLPRIPSFLTLCFTINLSVLSSGNLRAFHSAFLQRRAVPLWLCAERPVDLFSLHPPPFFLLFSGLFCGPRLPSSSTVGNFFFTWVPQFSRVILTSPRWRDLS